MIENGKHSVKALTRVSDLWLLLDTGKGTCYVEDTAVELIVDEDIADPYVIVAENGKKISLCGSSDWLMNLIGEIALSGRHCIDINPLVQSNGNDRGGDDIERLCAIISFCPSSN
jgi:hypothetical protein